jgi:hypothetical protein
MRERLTPFAGGAESQPRAEVKTISGWERGRERGKTAESLRPLLGVVSRGVIHTDALLSGACALQKRQEEEGEQKQV